MTGFVTGSNTEGIFWRSMCVPEVNLTRICLLKLTGAFPISDVNRPFNSNP